MEHVIVNQVSPHLEPQWITDRNKHGFQKRLSTKMQFIYFTQELHTGTANDKQVSAVAMDFSKTFVQRLLV